MLVKADTLSQHLTKTVLVMTSTEESMTQQLSNERTDSRGKFRHYILKRIVNPVCKVGPIAIHQDQHYLPLIEGIASREVDRTENWKEHKVDVFKFGCLCYLGNLHITLDEKTDLPLQQIWSKPSANALRNRPCRYASLVNANFSVNQMCPIICGWKLVKHRYCFGDNRRTKDNRKIKLCGLKACCVT